MEKGEMRDAMGFGTRPLFGVGEFPGIPKSTDRKKSASQQVAPISTLRWDLLARFHGSLARQEALREK